MYKEVDVDDIPGRDFINKVLIPSAHSAFSSPVSMFSSTKKNEVVEVKAKAEDKKSAASMAPSEPPSEPPSESPSGCTIM